MTSSHPLPVPCQRFSRLASALVAIPVSRAGLKVPPRANGAADVGVKPPAHRSR
jgi:hypothetical protein